MNLTNVLLGGCGALLGFTLARLWIMNGDLRSIRVALSGLNGANGLVEAVQELEVSRGKHHVAIAILSGRMGDIDGKQDVEL